jgi:transposase-like protein
MGQKGQKNRCHNLEFKEMVVRQRVVEGISLRQIRRTYNLSSENVVKWTRRYLSGEPLEMSRGRPKTRIAPSPSLPQTEEGLRVENERLKAELALKDELIKLLEERAGVKKKTDSKSFGD